MFRPVPYLLGLMGAFGIGFAVVFALLDEGPNEPAVTLSLDWTGIKSESTHSKLPAPTSEERQAALPPQPGADETQPERDHRPAPLARTLTQLVGFTSAPFPFDGTIPDNGKPFLNHGNEDRRGRKTPSGRIYWADTTYGDNRVLLHLPAGFDAQKPAVMVVFFHGHGATLQRDVMARQRLPQQITGSGINAVLVAPQFAVDARDSSAGKFWEPGGMRRFLDEVSAKLTALHGDTTTKGAFADMPVVIIGYSGGYLPTASAIARGQIEDRLKGVVLLDGLYGKVDTFADWIAGNKDRVFLSAYTGSTARGNGALRKKLAERDIAYSKAIAPTLQPGSVTIIEVDEDHRHYVTHAWTEDPVSDLLKRLTGTSLRVSVSASLSPGAKN